jgi:hypothetical protein
MEPAMRIVIEIDQAGTDAQQVRATSDAAPASDTGQSPGAAAAATPINAGAAPSRPGAPAAIALSDTSAVSPDNADAGQAISAGPAVLPA